MHFLNVRTRLENRLRTEMPKRCIFSGLLSSLYVASSATSLSSSSKEEGSQSIVHRSNKIVRAANVTAARAFSSST